MHKDNTKNNEKIKENKKQYNNTPCSTYPQIDYLKLSSFLCKFVDCFSLIERAT